MKLKLFLLSSPYFSGIKVLVLVLHASWRMIRLQKSDFYELLHQGDAIKN
jgi:hypothetical protein